jgi:hypothetical protein
MSRDHVATSRDEDTTISPSIASEGAQTAESTGDALRQLTADVADGVREEAIETEALRRANVLLGDRCLAVGRFYEARKAYRAAGAEIPPEKLIACGDQCLADDRLAEARDAYATAGATEQLHVVGRRYWAKGECSLSLDAYAVARATEIERERGGSGALLD